MPSHQSFTIRPAEASEAGLITDLRLACLLSLEMPGDPLDSVAAFAAMLPAVDAGLVSAGRYFVAESGGDLIGGAGWSVLPLSFRGEGVVSEDGRSAAMALDRDAVLVRGFFLDPDVGGRSLGASVLARVEEEAARAGHSALELVVPASAQLMYRSLGFRPVRRLALQTGEGLLPLMQMRKRLAPRLKSAA